MATTQAQPETPAADLDSAEWWTLAELSRRWKCSRDTVARRIKAGELKARKMGGWRVHRTAIEAFEKSAKVAAGPVPRRSAVPDVLGLYAKGGR